MTSATRPDDALDQGGLDEIDVAECWRLLGTQPVGRVAVIVGQYPLVFPVNYALDGMHIVFRTGVGTKLWAIDRSNVTFEVDELDLASRSGWSVMVRGAAHEPAPSRCQPRPAVSCRGRPASEFTWCGSSLTRSPAGGSAPQNCRRPPISAATCKTERADKQIG